MSKGVGAHAGLAIILIVLLVFTNLSSATSISGPAGNAVETQPIPKGNPIQSNPAPNPNSPVSAMVGNISTTGPSYMILYDSILNLTYALSQSGILFVVADSTDSVIANISVGTGITDMIYDPSNGFIYLSGPRLSSITVVYGTSVISSVFIGFNTYPTSMIYDPENEYVLVAYTSFLTGFVAFPEIAAISGTQIINFWSYGGQPSYSIGIFSNNQYFVQNLTYNPSNGNVYVSNEQMGVVAIYGEQALITVLPDPVSMIFDPANSLIYVASSSGAIQAIDTLGVIVATVPGILGSSFSQTPFLFDPANNDLLLFNESGNMIFVLNSSNVVVANISDGTPTNGIYDPANRLAYVGSVNNNYVVGIDANLQIQYDFTILPNVLTGTASMSLGQNAMEIYLANSNVNFITVIGSNAYPVYFYPVGLPKNTSCGGRVGWSVSLGGNFKTSGPTSIEFLEINGSFSYYSASSGFAASPGAGTVNVAGEPVNVSINFTVSDTFEIQSQLSLSGIFLKNFTLDNLVELHLGMGPERPYSVTAVNGASSYPFNETNCSQGIYQASIDMGSLTGNSIEIIADYNNTTQTRNISINMVNEPLWLQSMMSIGFDNVMQSNYQWNNTYTIYVGDTFPFLSLFGQNVNIPMIGGQYGFFPNVDSSLLINSNGSILMNAHIASPSISIAGISTNSIPGLPITFSLSLTGQFTVNNGNVIWTSSTMTVSVSGSVSIPIPIVGYSFNVPDVGSVNIGLSVTITVAPTFVLDLALAPSNSSSSQFIANLDVMITSITSQISIAVSAALNAGIGVASISGGGTLTFNINMSIIPSPLTIGGNVQGSLFVNWNALIWSGTIWTSGAYNLFSWGPTTLSHISRITFNSTKGNASNFTLTPRYYNTSNYQSYRWVNGQWNGTAINDVYPYARFTSASSNNSTYVLSSFDNVSLNERHGLGIRIFLSNSTSRNLTNLPEPRENGFIITNPEAIMLENGSLGVLWIAVPYNGTNVSNPFSVTNILLQYSIFNTSTWSWSKPDNITTSGIANSYSIAQLGGTIYVIVLWSSNSTSSPYLAEFAISKYLIFASHSDVVYSTLNMSLSGASNIVSFKIEKNGFQNILVQFENGSYGILGFRPAVIGPPSVVRIVQLPSLYGYSIKQAGLASNSTDILFVLYTNGSYGDIFVAYNISNLSSPVFISNLFMHLPVSTSSVRMIYGNKTSFVGVSILDQTKYLDKLQIFCLGTLPGWKSKPDVRSFFNFTVNIRNITYFNIEKTDNAVLSYAMSNYGNMSRPTMNLVLTYNAITPPPSPILQITNYNQREISLNWSVPGGSEYSIQRYLLNSSLDGHPYSSVILPNNTTDYSFQVGNGGSYKFWVYAIDPFGMSQRSNFASITYYNATFVETGLPSGELFQVDLNGTLNSGTTKVVFSVTNGTYSFRASSNGSMKINPSFGRISIQGFPVTTYIFFTINSSYLVNFTETGLPAGYKWSLTNGAGTYSSTSQHLSLYLSNGSYPISFSAAKYTAYPGSLVITVNGTMQSHMITFASPSTSVYNITFFESGLKRGTQWGIFFNGVLSTSARSLISVYEPDGYYSFTIQQITGYSSTPLGGNITVNGGNVFQNITFSTRQVILDLTFILTGTNSGASWSVTVGNRTMQSSSLNITFLLPSGTYNYTISPPKGYGANITKGTVDLTVNKTIYIKASKSVSSQGINPWYYIIPVIIIFLALIAIAAAMRMRRSGKDKTT